MRRLYLLSGFLLGLMVAGGIQVVRQHIGRPNAAPIAHAAANPEVQVVWQEAAPAEPQLSPEWNVVPPARPRLSRELHAPYGTIGPAQRSVPPSWNKKWFNGQPYYIVPLGSMSAGGGMRIAERHELAPAAQVELR